MGAFLDAVYGVLVQPASTFAALRQRPQVLGAAVLVLLVSSLGLGDPSVGSLLAMGLEGLLGWVTLNGILWLMAYSLGRDPQGSVLLTLTGFASAPWLLWLPAQAWGSFWGSLLAVGVGVWFVTWQVWATSVALDLSWRRLLWVLPLPFLGLGVGLTWLGNTLGLVLSLG